MSETPTQSENKEAVLRNSFFRTQHASDGEARQEFSLVVSLLAPNLERRLREKYPRLESETGEVCNKVLHEFWEAIRGRKVPWESMVKLEKWLLNRAIWRMHDHLRDVKRGKRVGEKVVEPLEAHHADVCFDVTLNITDANRPRRKDPNPESNVTPQPRDVLSAVSHSETGEIVKQLQSLLLTHKKISEPRRELLKVVIELYEEGQDPLKKPNFAELGRRLKNISRETARTRYRATLSWLLDNVDEISPLKKLATLRHEKK